MNALSINAGVGSYAAYKKSAAATSTTANTASQAPQQNQAATVEISQEALTLQANQQPQPLGSHVLDMARAHQATLRITSEIHGHADRPAFYRTNTSTGDFLFEVGLFAIQHLGMDSQAAHNFNYQMRRDIFQSIDPARRMAAVTMLEHLALTHFTDEEEAARFLGVVYAVSANGALHEQGWWSGEHFEAPDGEMIILPPRRMGEIGFTYHNGTSFVRRIGFPEELGLRTSPNDSPRRTDRQNALLAEQAERAQRQFGRIDFHSLDNRQNSAQFQETLVDFLRDIGRNSIADRIIMMFNTFNSLSNNGDSQNLTASLLQSLTTP